MNEGESRTLKSARSEGRQVTFTAITREDGTAELAVTSRITGQLDRQVTINRDEMYEALGVEPKGPAKPVTLRQWAESGSSEPGAHWVTPISGNHVLNDVHRLGADVNLSVNPDIPGVVQVVVGSPGGGDLTAFVSSAGLAEAALQLDGWTDGSPAPEIAELRAKLAKVEALISEWRREGVDEDEALAELCRAVSDFELPTLHGAVIEGKTSNGSPNILTLLRNVWYTNSGVVWTKDRIYSQLTDLRLLRDGIMLPQQEPFAS